MWLCFCIIYYYYYTSSICREVHRPWTLDHMYIHMCMYTLHAIIISGGVRMCEKKISTLQSSWKWDWAILTHGNGRYCYYKHIIFCTEIERCQPFFPAAGFGASMEFHPLGQPSREDESTPRERFLNFTLRVWLWKPEYTYVYIYTPYISYIYIYIYIYVYIHITRATHMWAPVGEE
jgi:hypothetical protein